MMKSRYFSTLFFYFLFLLTSISSIYAQPIRLQFKHMTTDDGLSSSSVISILQDHRGLVWIGTYDGLNRYDGFNFVVYKNNPADSTSLADNLVKTMIEDHDKNLLIGTQNGLCLYDREKDHFLNYMLDKSSPLRGINCIVSKIAEDSLGSLWLATSVGLIYFDRVENRIIHFTHDPNNPESLSDDNVESVLIDKNYRLWVATRKGLNLFLPETRTFKHITLGESDADDLSNTFFLDMKEDWEGTLWFGSTEGLYSLKNNPEGKITNLIHYQHDAQDKFSLSNNRIKSLYVDDMGNLWIGIENDGINLFDRETQRFWHYRKDDYDPKSLNNESIETIYQDKTGNLWIGTFTGGLNIAFKNKDAIIHYQTLPGAPFSLSHNTVTCFLEDHQGHTWVGTDGGGLNLFDVRTNRFLRFNMDNSHLSSNAILCIMEDSNNQIWLGTWGGGLIHYDSKTKSFTSLTTKNSGIQDDNIYTIAEGDRDDLWLGSFEHGLIHYQIKEKKFTNYTPDNSSLTNKMVIKIKKFSKGRLLIGSTNCFQIFSPGEDRFVTFMPDPHDANSLSYPTTTDILVENDTCVWIGTHHGLNRFNPNTGSFKRFYEKDGLPSDVIKGLALDKSGVLWVTSNKGVCRLDYKRGEFKNFTKGDGLQSNEFYERSILNTKNGALLMGGIKGFNIVYPEKITENKNIPDVLITDLKLFNARVEPGTKNSPLIQDITETKNLTLSYKQSILTFYFAAMDFTAPEKNQYAYIMENFDEKWIYAGNKREATYTNLNPGEYVFRVKGSNNDGIWNEKGTSIRITITPPYWKTLWFRLILLAVFSGIVYWIYKWRVQARDLAAQRRMDTALTKERNLLRTLIDNIPDAIYVKDTTYRKTIANLADVHNMGLQSEAEVLGKDDFELFPKELADGFIADDRTVIQTGQPVINREEYVIDEQGQKRWLVTSKLPLHDENNQITGLVGIGRDVTEQKKMQESLQQERNLLRTLIDNLPDYVYIKDIEGRFVVANMAIVHQFGFNSPSELIGKSDYDLFPRELAERYFVDEQKIIQSGQGIYEYEGPTIDKSKKEKERWVTTVKVPLRDIQGKIISTVGISRDITERKKGEAEREKLIAQLQDALADVKLLSGLVPICANCKKIRDDQGYWTQIESYIQDRSDAKFSHSICPDCAAKLYPGYLTKK